jgi:hypothetical protein
VARGQLSSCPSVVSGEAAERKIESNEFLHQDGNQPQFDARNAIFCGGVAVGLQLGIRGFLNLAQISADLRRLAQLRRRIRGLRPVPRVF